MKEEEENLQRMKCTYFPRTYHGCIVEIILGSNINDLLDQYLKMLWHVVQQYDGLGTGGEHLGENKNTLQFVYMCIWICLLLDYLDYNTPRSKS